MSTNVPDTSSRPFGSDSPAKPPCGCLVIALALGLLWVAFAVLWCVGFYRQETAKIQADAGISGHLRVVQGTLTAASGHGRRLNQPDYYTVTYRYPLPNGEPFTARTTVQADQLARLGLTDHDASFLFAHPRSILVEVDSRDPTRSRLQGVPYQGGSSPATLWLGEAAGVFIGLFGFLFLCGGLLRALWLSRR